MLNQKQLNLLNDIFHSVIKPVLEEEKEQFNHFMEKVEEFEANTPSNNQIKKIEEGLLNCISNQIIVPWLNKDYIQPRYQNIDNSKDIDMNFEIQFSNINNYSKNNMETISEKEIKLINEKSRQGIILNNNIFAA